MNIHPDASLPAACLPVLTRLDEPAVAELLRSASRSAPNTRDDMAAQLRARLLKMIVANESARKKSGEGPKPR